MEEQGAQEENKGRNNSCHPHRHSQGSCGVGDEGERGAGGETAHQLFGLKVFPILHTPPQARPVTTGAKSCGVGDEGEREAGEETAHHLIGLKVFPTIDTAPQTRPRTIAAKISLQTTDLQH